MTGSPAEPEGAGSATSADSPVEDPFDSGRFDQADFDRAFEAEFGPTTIKGGDKEPISEAEGSSEAAPAPPDDPDPTTPPVAPVGSDQNQARYLAIVWTPVASAEALAGLCALQGIDTLVIPTSRGALVIEEEDVSPELDLELMSAGVPERIIEIATLLARLSSDGVAVLSSRVDRSEEGLAGDLRAYHFGPTGESETVPAGLLLTRADAVIEGLATGRVLPADIEGGIRSGELSTRTATKFVRKGLRRRRR